MIPAPHALLDLNDLGEDNSDQLRCIEKFIGDDACQLLAESLKGDQKKKIVTLKGNCIGTKGAYALSQMLVMNNCIEFLSLEWNQLGSAGVAFFGSALANNKGLTHLDLRNNDVTDEGAISLSESLTINKTLKMLDLRWNQITDRVGNQLSSEGYATIDKWSKSNISNIDIQHDVQLPIPLDIPVENNIFQADMQALRNQLNERMKISADHERQLQYSASRITELEQNLLREKFHSEQANESLKHLKIRLQEKTSEIETLTIQWNTERNEINEEIKSIVNEKDILILSLTNAKDSAARSIVKLEADVVRLRAQLQSEQASYEQELSVAREVRDEALKKADESAAKESAMSIENRFLRGAVDSARAHEEALARELAQCRLDMQLAVQSEVARRDTEVKSLEESLNRTIVRLTTERADLAKAVAAREQEISRFQLSLPEKLEAAVALAREEERRRATNIADELRSRIDSLNQMRQRLELRCSELVAQDEKMRSDQALQSADLRDQLNQALEELAKAREAEQHMQQSVFQSGVDLASVTRQLTESVTELNRIRTSEQRWHGELTAVLAEKNNLELKVSGLNDALNSAITRRAAEFVETRDRVIKAVSREFDSLQVLAKIALPLDQPT